MVAALERRGVRAPPDRLGERGVQQRRADVPPARGLGDDRGPGSRPAAAREERLAELEADEARPGTPSSSGEHRAGVGTAYVLGIGAAQRRQLLLGRRGTAQLGEQPRGGVEVAVVIRDPPDLDAGGRGRIPRVRIGPISKYLPWSTKPGRLVQRARRGALVTDLQLERVPATQPPLGDGGAEQRTADAPPAERSRTKRSLTQPSKVAWFSRRRNRKTMRPAGLPSATARNGVASTSLTSAS